MNYLAFKDNILFTLSEYKNFYGITQRKDYWIWMSFLFSILVFSQILTQLTHFQFTFLSLLYLTPATAAITARRFHDIKMSGWFQLSIFIPFLGWALMIFWMSMPSKK
jgi:uncharacterized membrane protein YhaH (DUF805 family)